MNLCSFQISNVRRTDVELRIFLIIYKVQKQLDKYRISIYIIIHSKIIIKNIINHLNFVLQWPWYTFGANNQTAQTYRVKIKLWNASTQIINNNYFWIQFRAKIKSLAITHHISSVFLFFFSTEKRTIYLNLCSVHIAVRYTVQHATIPQIAHQ